MEIELLKYYLKVAETLNFTDAAESLFISQATLSRKISMLEEELGVRLFERTTRSVQLSEAGKLCLQDAKRIIENYDTLLLRTQGIAGQSAGTIRIGYFRTDTAEYLARIVLRMRKEHPAIQIEYEKDELENLIDGLDSGSLDAVLLFHPCISDDKNYERITIAHEYPSIIVSQIHPLASRGEVPLTELTDQKVILHYGQDVPESINQAVRHYFLSLGIELEADTPDESSYKQFLQVRLGEVIMIDPFATASSGLPDAFTRLRIPSDDAMFNRDFIMKKNNTNPLSPYLKRIVTAMVREGMFE